MTTQDSTPSVRFTATLEQSGKSATGMVVPDDLVEQLGAGKRPPVTVAFNGHTYRSTVASMGGQFMVGVSAENRAAAGVEAGEVIDVELTLDKAPREIEVPADFAEALAAEPVADEFFASLSYSNKRWHVESVTGAKTDATRERRIAKSVAMLAERRKR
ncbi:MAG: YdeI/OmpD-associated family protein [Actinomycetia bacterium]|nr:YdeI/OmpD-associated family protein [Actinomycetes bacterium]